MTRARRDAYYTPTEYSLRRQRQDAAIRTVVPLLIVFGMVAIPWVSLGLLGQSDGVAYAQSLPPEWHVAQPPAELMVRTLRSKVREEQLDAMKHRYLRTRNVAIVRGDFEKYAEDVAAGRYVHIPRDIRRIIRDHLSDADIREVKLWLEETRPTPDELIRAGKLEFSENLEEFADEFRFREDAVA
ncbi:MAG: hypothetical protein KDC38_19825, partial [Planctomycetes bacterium]|nr:hypothetical protein [Planctomycetota bacterium]